MMNDRSAPHIVVVGAGAFGGWTALSLVRRGARVTLVDGWGAGHSRSSSGDETRLIRTMYDGRAVYTDMAVRALSLWRDAEVTRTKSHTAWNKQQMLIAKLEITRRLERLLRKLSLCAQPIRAADGFTRHSICWRKSPTMPMTGMEPWLAIDR